MFPLLKSSNIKETKRMMNKILNITDSNEEMCAFVYPIKDNFFYEPFIATSSQKRFGANQTKT